MANSWLVVRTTVVLIALLALGAGCSGSSEQPALDGSWKLSSWAEPDPIPAGVTITAEFADGRVSGNSGVNQYNAAITSSTDGSLAVEQAVSTLMAGPPEAMAAEHAYLTRLQAASSYAIDGDTLVIKDADGQSSLTFARV